MAGPDSPSESPYVRRIAKIEKINAALIHRVERSLDQQGNAYSLFQTAIGLESQVRSRTEELKAALLRLGRTNDELVTARDAAERANRIKTRFFTAVGHDLLQPLHAAKLSLSALGGPERDSASRRLVNQIEHALSTVEDLLKTILDISKLEAGIIKPSLQPVGLAEMFASLALDMYPIARSKHVALTLRPTKLAVLSDRPMLRRILQNLLANAVRYTEHGGIKLVARRRGSNVRIEVWDTGPGIPAEECERIFEEFQRGAAAERTSHTGFGLGLSIVQRAAEALGHHVDLCSRVGHGSRFAVTVPYLGTIDSVAPSPAHPGEADAYGFASIKVFVIDNDDAVLEAMNALLARWSCETRVSRGQGDLQSLLGSPGFRPDIVLADFHLDRGASGLDVVAELRRSLGVEIPVIVITADHSPGVAEAVRSADCELLCKPVKPAELRALMLHLLR